MICYCVKFALLCCGRNTPAPKGKLNTTRWFTCICTLLKFQTACSKKQSFEKLLYNNRLLALILTVLTVQSFHGMISTIRTNGYFVRSAFLSNTKTKSPILIFLRKIFHFLQIVSDGIYSVMNAWTIFYLALLFIWFSFKTKISRFVNANPIRG